MAEKQFRYHIHIVGVLSAPSKELAEAKITNAIDIRAALVLNMSDLRIEVIPEESIEDLSAAFARRPGA